MEIKRRRTRPVMVGNVGIGGDFPISIQSMTKTKTSQVKATVEQIRELEKNGCEIIRVSVKDEEDARAIKKIKDKIKIPLEADIHFHYKLALLSLDSGCDALRLNPGNIYKIEEIEKIVKMAKEMRIPIRIGINSGSLQKGEFKIKDEKLNLGDLMVKTAINYIKILERMDFFEIIVSLKASGVLDTIDAYRKMADLCDYPFHLGITATGLSFEGRIKSAIGIGILLAEGIGDTIRVSLTAHPREEIEVAKCILSSLGLRKFGPEIVACPICGRAQIDVIKITQELKKALLSLHTNLPTKIAIMGCEVNGPGEACDADIGIAGGKRCGILFKKGKIIRRINEKEIIAVLLKEIDGLSKISGLKPTS